MWLQICEAQSLLEFGVTGMEIVNLFGPVDHRFAFRTTALRQQPSGSAGIKMLAVPARSYS